MPNPIYLPELREMLASGNIDEMREFLEALHPARTAEFMEGLEPGEIWAILQQADMPLRRAIFGFFDDAIQAKIIEQADRDEAAEFIAELPSDDRVDMLADVEPEIVDELMPKIDVEERRDIQRLQAYEEETAGAEMTTEFARLDENMTVEEALREIGRQAEELETIYYLYVVDDRDHLRGLVSAKSLVRAMKKPQTRLSEIMECDLVTVHVNDDQEEMARKVARYNLLAIPVVDDEYRMLGIVTHDDVIDVIVDEMAEDAYRSAAVEPLDESYLATSVMELTWKRGVWLTVLFFGAMVTAMALEAYHATLNAVEWLVFFIPVVISTGGNSGNQSATLIITALSTEGITLKDWWQVVRRELAMGCLLGGFLGACGYVCALAMIESDHVAIAALVIPATLILVTIFGTLSGSLLPLLFRRLGWDPALMSNPFVAGLVDVVGIIIYMLVARAILRI